MNDAGFEIEIAMALECLSRDDGVIAVPTDTTYGVICRLDRLTAIDRIYELKGRDRSKPLIILAAGLNECLPFIEGDTAIVDLLGKRFWPGALTVVARASAKVPVEMLSSGTTVGLRVPAHPTLRHLLSALPNGAVASTSANLSGGPTPKTIDEVIASLSDRIDYIMPNCDQNPAGSESTIVDVTSDKPRVLREGSLPSATVVEAISNRR